jgi:hypothetical protein
MFFEVFDLTYHSPITTGVRSYPLAVLTPRLMTITLEPCRVPNALGRFAFAIPCIESGRTAPAVDSCGQRHPAEHAKSLSRVLERGG